MSISLGHTANGVNSIIQNLRDNNFKITPSFDGKYQRFDRIKPKSGWCISSIVVTKSGKRIPMAVAGDWCTGEKFKFFDSTTDEVDRDEIKNAIERAMEEEGKKRKERAEFAIAVAAEEWNLADASRLSPYMESKGFNGNFGARVAKDGTLLVPTYAEGIMYGLERIYKDGSKRYLSGQRMKGCYYTIGEVQRETLSFICEGFATGCSINTATGRPVVVAFSANNMVDVAKAFIGFNMVAAGDNDRFTEGNPGVTVAFKAAAMLGSKPLIPQFPPEDEQSTDFNDMHMKYGVDLARKQLEVPVNNVVGIRSKVEKKASKKMSEVYKAISDAMQGKNISPVPDFPVRFHVVEPSPGTRLIAQEGDPEVVHYVSEKAVVQAILQYAHNLYLPRTNEGVGFEQRHASDCMKFWRDIVEPIPEPKMVSWPGEDGYTLRRLPWPMELGKTTVFDEMMKRTSNSSALKKFIGSLFFPDADLQQYVWLFSDGQTGKGALSRFLRRALNGAYSAQMVPSPNDKFWTSGLIGARLVVFPDCNNRTFVASGLFKSLTGGDPIKIERKGEQPFTTELKAKYMFLSNEKPHLSSEKADMRRAIFCEMDALTEDTRPSYEDELWAEGGRFLASCFSEYQAACPQHGIIKLNAKENQGLEDWVSTVEEEFEIAAKKHFYIGPQYSCTPSDFNKKLNAIWEKDRQSQSNFRTWLERKYQVKKKTSRPHGDIKIYSGIAVIGYSVSVPIVADTLRTPCGQERGQQESQEPVDVDGADM